MTHSPQPCVNAYGSFVLIVWSGTLKKTALFHSFYGKSAPLYRKGSSQIRVREEPTGQRSYNAAPFNLSEFVTTNTELNAIAAAAMIGLSCNPRNG